MGRRLTRARIARRAPPGIGLFPHAITLGTFDIQVGPVPVTVTPKLQLYLSGQATIEAKATFSLEQGASVTVGASYEHGSFHPISSLSQHFTPTFTAEGDASGEIALTPTVDTLIYDVAGPSFDVGAVAKLNANVKSTPWWTLQGCLQAGLGFVISPLGLNWSDPHLIQFCKTLLSASTPPPASAIAASTVPTNTSPPTITDEQGNNPPKVGDTLHASTGSWTGSPTEYTYHWEDCKPAGSCNSNLLASTTPTYRLTEHDLGETLRVSVTAINAAGSSEPVPSPTTGVVAKGTATGPGGGQTSSGAIAIAAGEHDTCALLADASIDCWGLNSTGELGDGTNSGDGADTGSDTCGIHNCRPTPVAVSGITNATAITGGTFQACTLLTDGSIDCWGSNYVGELGDGTTEESDTPVAVSGITSATAINAGASHTCAVLTGGHVNCWGGNDWGELGDGTTEGSATPVAVSGITDATALTTGGYDTCALLVGGSVNCWGRNSAGELGDGTTQERNAPVSVSGITNATAITAGAYHTCALLAGGSIDCWGNGGFGGLGDGSTKASETPVAVNGITNATAITAGDEDTCALLASGNIDCWGNNSSGELGNGTTEASDTPVAVNGITNATAITAGGWHTCALLPGGSIDCWGNNQYGELGNGTTEGEGPQYMSFYCLESQCRTTPGPVSGFE